MRKWLGIICLLAFCAPVWGYAADQNLFFLAGKNTPIAEGDMYNRAVYAIEVSSEVATPFYLRVFDADLAGAHDRWFADSEGRYRVYGKGAIDWTLRKITDPLPAAPPLAEVILGEHRAYDNQWRTLAELQPADGEPGTAAHYFQLVVDGLRGRAINKYQVFVSGQEKENVPVAGVKITTPVVMLAMPAAPGLATQLRFAIPPEAECLEVFNFDADLLQKKATIHFETQFTQAIPITSSKDGQVTSTKIPLEPNVRGKIGALVLRNPKESNFIQFWVTDDRGRPLMLELPTLTGPDNHLPTADFTAVPLSECLSVLLDASASSDIDNDELDFEWLFPDGSRKPGRRIVHSFAQAGTYNVTLTVSDRSGFVANSSTLTRAITINQPPIAVIAAPAKVAINQVVKLDASDSQDADGAILKYLWNLGDGAKAEGATPTYRYTRAGKYLITLHVEDDSQSLCRQASVTHQIWVNAPPVPHVNVKAIAAVGEMVSLTAAGSIDSDGEIRAYAWDFGDATTAEGLEVTHAWTQPGIYTVRLKVTDDAGLDNSSAVEQTTIVINAPPVPRAAYRDVIAAAEEVRFDAAASTDQDGTIRQYVWQMGDGTRKEGVQIRHAYAAPGVYTVTLTVTDDTDTLNNTVSTTFPVRVNAPPTPVAGEDRVVNTSEVTFDASASTDQDDPIIAYAWDFGDGRGKQGRHVTHVYALPGTYTATLTVTDASGTRSANQSDTVEIRINHPPIADAGGAQIVAPGEKVIFDGSFSEDPDGQIVSYQWEVAAREIFDQARIEYQYRQPGKYQTRLTVTDNNGLMSTDYVLITVNAQPIADFHPSPCVAPGQVVAFDSAPSVDADGAIRQAWWDFGDGTPVQEGRALKHSFAAPGRYPVTLTIQDDSPAMNNSAARTRMIEVNFPPRANAGADVHTCDQRVTFDASQSTDPDGDALLYIWEFGDGARDYGRRVEHTYQQPGIYPVTLVVNDGHGVNNSTARAALTAYVNAPPVPNIKINSQTVCAGELVLFDAGQSTDLEKGLLRYEWDLGDGKPVEGINPVHEYTQGGDYRIRLRVTDDSGLTCNTADAETMLHVIDAPIANAGEDLTVCANILVQFDGSASTGGGRRIKTYEWEFGDGQFGVGVNPAHVYAREGQYTARLVITVAGEGECANVSEDEVTVRVMAAPVATFQVTKAACAEDALLFDATASHAPDSQITVFDWTFGDGASGSGATVTHGYQTPGTYQARLRITSAATGTCSAAEYTETIRINAVPVPIIRVAAAGQEPSSGAHYDTDPQTVLYFSGAESSDADGYITSYTWNFGDGQQAAGPFVSHQYAAPGEYSITLQVQDNSQTACQSNTRTLLIRVRQPEKQAITGPAAVCVGQPVEYTVAADDQSVVWSLNDGVTATGSPFRHAFQVPGTYQLQAQIGMDWMPVKEITALQLPDLRLPERLDLYPNDTLELQPAYQTATGLPLQFHWDSGDGGVFSTERLTYAYAQSGQFTLQLQVMMVGGPECLRAVYHIPVTVHAPPEIAIQISPEQPFTGGAHDAVRFEAALADTAAQWNYAWDFGDGDAASGQRVSHTYLKAATYQVTVTLSDPLLRTVQNFVFATQVNVKQRQE